MFVERFTSQVTKIPAHSPLRDIGTLSLSGSLHSFGTLPNVGSLT